MEDIKIHNIKRHCLELWSDPKKLDNIKEQKLFKQPKGLVVCEEQAASP